MWTLFYLSVLSFVQASDDRRPQDSSERLSAVLERASKEPDLDGAGLVLSSLLSDEPTIRSVFLTSVVPDERSVYVLFGRQCGSRAGVTWKDGMKRQRILVESVSTKPMLVHSVIRAERYESYFERRHPRGAATINSFPFFAYSPYADDLVERYIETLRKETTHRAEPIVSPYNELRAKGSPPQVLLTAEEMEVNLLDIWQTLCGVCDRLDLIDKATTETWRGRFTELDKWFKESRPYILWDDKESHCRIDAEAKDMGRPTPRTARLIPELKPPWALGGDGIRRD
jgi:hypothetical protein